MIFKNNNNSQVANIVNQNRINKYLLDTANWREATDVETQEHLAKQAEQNKPYVPTADELYASKITAYIRSQGYSADKVEAIMANLETARSNPSLPKSIEYINEYKAYQAVRAKAKELAKLNP